MAFDTSKSQLTKNNFAIGYTTGDFTLHTNVNDGQVSIFLWENVFTEQFVSLDQRIDEIFHYFSSSGQFEFSFR